MKSVCVVCEYGWIIKGIQGESKNGELCLHNAAVVRKWNNGKGIGGIAMDKNKNDYVLDYIGDVEIKQNKILFIIPCEW